MDDRHKGRILHDLAVGLPVEGEALLIIQLGRGAIQKVIDLRVLI